jgi:lipoate-protein ligase A
MWNMNKEWYLIVDETPQKGAWNMAVDDYLFHSLGDEPMTFLRFYRWERPTVSLGYSQRADQVVDLEFCRKNGIDIVRRMTGGKLVLHHQEVTYCICSSDVEIFSPKLMDSYRVISEALMRGLERMGIRCTLAGETPSFYVRGSLPCFSHPARNEIEVEGKKIVGSAQKRTKSRFIQHGSIPLIKDEMLLKAVSKMDQAQSFVRMTSLSELRGEEVPFHMVVDHLVAGISAHFQIGYQRKNFSGDEMDLIRKIQKERYDNPEWNFGKGGSVSDADY